MEKGRAHALGEAIGSPCQLVSQNGPPSAPEPKRSLLLLPSPARLSSCWPSFSRQAPLYQSFSASSVSLVAQLVKNPPAMWETWVQKIPWRREKPPILVFWPGEFHERYSAWGRKESHTAVRLSLFFAS